MRYAVTARQMKACDRNTIERFGLPSLVLQERAATSVCNQIAVRFSGKKLRVRIYAGAGNNGADALACARILTERGHAVDTVLLGDAAKRTEEFCAQLRTLDAYGFTTRLFSETAGKIDAPELILDGILGVGSDRALAGDFLDAVREINACHDAGAHVIAIDIATGVHADDGRILGDAVMADETVVFAFVKTGQLLYPGATYGGAVTVADIGVTSKSFLTGTEDAVTPKAVYFGAKKDAALPERAAAGNKGTFGKVLIVAGSDTTCGAALLAAESALRAGCGMVRLFTAIENREAIQTKLPEALTDFYARDDSWDAIAKKLSDALAWADGVVLGCGIGVSDTAARLVETILTSGEKHLILDADALNLIAASDDLQTKLAAYRKDGRQVVLTPHLAEFARLTKRNVADCAREILDAPQELSGRLHATVLCKDARSVVADETRAEVYVNVSGNDGMATAGSGDALAGLCGALCLSTRDGFETASLAAYYHGLAGDFAARRIGKRAMIASDLIESFSRVMREQADADGN